MDTDIHLIVTYWYNWIAEDDVATVEDDYSSPPIYTSTGDVESPHPSAPLLPPPPSSEQPSYPVHATGQAPYFGVDIHKYQTPLNYPRQMFYQSASGGVVVTGVSVLLDICFNPKNSLAAFFCFFINFYLQERLSVFKDWEISKDTSLVFPCASVTKVNNIVLTLHLQQPVDTMMPQTVQLTTAPKDHSMLAWFACLCCFCPVGIIAVIKSNQVRYYKYTFGMQLSSNIFYYYLYYILLLTT